jgi:small subunit ribosomal protein S21
MTGRISYNEIASRASLHTVTEKERVSRGSVNFIGHHPTSSSSAASANATGLIFAQSTINCSPKKEVRKLTSVNLRPNESQDQLFKRFRKKVAKSGILSTVRRKRWFVSKSELRRIDKKKAIRRSRRRQAPDSE